MTKARNRQRHLLFGIATVAACGSGILSRVCLADSSEAKYIEDYYLNEVQSNGSLYKTSPVTHIVPSYKEITFALDAQYIDLTLDGSGLERGRTNDSEIDLSGYTFTPYVAISLKRIGLGFSAEAGNKIYEYRDGGSNSQQKSNLDYRAIGVYMYLLPFENTPNWLTASVVLGAKNYNASHQVSNETSGTPGGRDYTKYRYATQSYLAGTLLDFHFLKRFSIVPWLDYTYTSMGQLNEAAKDKRQGSNGYYLQRQGEIFWRGRPQTEVGIDLVCRFELLSIHLGDFLAPLAYQVDDSVIQNRSVQLSISTNMKGD